jgi:hypothetical protein
MSADVELAGDLHESRRTSWLIRASDARFTARQEWQAHAAGWETGLPGVGREHGPRKSAASGSLPDAA